MTELVTSRGGYARLQQRLQEALDSYNAVCATNAEAADAGDSSVWHDNFAYEENRARCTNSQPVSPRFGR